MCIRDREYVEILKIESNVNKRKLLDEIEILKVKIKNKNPLMNIKKKFNNE